jgi:glycogen synthase
VIGDIPSLRELWDGAACLVPPDDERALAATINALAADSRQRNAIANAARARARRYSTERMTAAYLALYGALLPRRNARVRPLLTGSG